MNDQLLIIEPYYGGSHKAMIDSLIEGLSRERYVLITLPAKKWHWKARCSAMWIHEAMPDDLSRFGKLFCSSVLNLAELVGFFPELAKLEKVVYFHENQLAYPVQTTKQRDVQYGYNQIATCLVADRVLFNSQFNMNSFVGNIRKFLKIIPAFKPAWLESKIKPKCEVLYYPVDYSLVDLVLSEKLDSPRSSDVLHIVWPHRWEFDKNPDAFFRALYRLKEEGEIFKVSVLGEHFSEEPPCFDQARIDLKDHIQSFGYVESKREFYEILSSAHVVVSTANHEFFGVSVMEAVRAGCFPLLPNRLVYPELFPDYCLYNSEEELFERLRTFCKNPRDTKLLTFNKDEVNTEAFNAKHIVPKLIKLLMCDSSR